MARRMAANKRPRTERGPPSRGQIMARSSFLHSTVELALSFDIAHIQIKSATHAAFEAAVAKAVPLFQRARGSESMRLERSIEKCDAYRLVVGWTTLEDHTVHFRGSDDFQAWRGLVGEFFAAPPQFEHMNTVVAGF